MRHTLGRAIRSGRIFFAKKAGPVYIDRMSLDKIAISWIRQTIGWSNSWPSWQERLVLLLFFVLALGVAFLSVAIGRTQGPTLGAVVSIALLWGAFFVAMTVCSWLGWLKLFGPVLFYDMVRTARRNRYFLMRMVYSAVLLVILCVLFFTASEMGFRRHHFHRDAAIREAALLAETFFSVFMIVQLILVGLLTPAYVAGAIAEEKDRKTLEFMLATDLTNREIVLSKLLSRVANMTLLLLTGLPILSILQFVGGVDAQLMLSGFAATGLTMLGIASVSILLSTLFQKPRDAIGLSYIFLIAYLAAGTLAKAITLARITWVSTPLGFGEFGPSLADLFEILNAGNPIAVIIDIIEGIERATLIADLPGMLLRYTLFHVGVSMVCVGWSIVRLRAIALRQTSAGTTKKLGWFDRVRPAIGELPMFWKELHIEGRMKLNWLAWGVVIVLVLLTLGSGIFILGMFVWDHMFERADPWWEMPMIMNGWFRIAGTGVLSLMILIVAVRASTSIAAERERDTFDALITTPMRAESMLAAKLVGTLTSLRLAWFWFGSMACLGILTGGLHPLAMPIVLGAWLVYATFFSMVGLWFSMACKSSMRATVYTVLTTLLLGGGHWVVLGFCCYMPFAILSRGGPDTPLEFMAKFQLGMTPPAVIGLYAYSWENLASDFRHDDFVKHVMLLSIFGLVVWAAASVTLWFAVLVPKFRAIARREDLVYE